MRRDGPGRVSGFYLVHVDGSVCGCLTLRMVANDYYPIYRAPDRIAP